MAEFFRRLNIYLDSTRGSRNLPIKIVGDFLTNLQTSVYHVGDYLAGGEFRARGHSIEYVQDRCELTFKDVKSGSFDAVLALQDPQTTLTGQPTLGEESLQKFCNILSMIENEYETPDKMEKQLENIIEDTQHRLRILGDVNRLWPSVTDGFNVVVNPPHSTKIILNPEKKFYLEAILKRESERKVTSIRGVLTGLNAYPSDALRIVGPDGNISLAMDNAEKAVRYFKKPIIAHGDARFDAAGNVMELLNVQTIEPFTETTLNRIFSGNDEIHLTRPLTVKVDWQRKNWIMTNKDFGIVATAKEYDDCLKDFNEQFFFVWKEYGLASDSKLTVGARELKRKILSIVKERPHL